MSDNTHNCSSYFLFPLAAICPLLLLLMDWMERGLAIHCNTFNSVPWLQALVLLGSSGQVAIEQINTVLSSVPFCLFPVRQPRSAALGTILPMPFWNLLRFLICWWSPLNSLHCCGFTAFKKNSLILIGYWEAEETNMCMCLVLSWIKSDWALRIASCLLLVAVMQLLPFSVPGTQYNTFHVNNGSVETIVFLLTLMGISFYFIFLPFCPFNMLFVVGPDYSFVGDKILLGGRGGCNACEHSSLFLKARDFTRMLSIDVSF